MFDIPISKMNDKQLRNAVQLLYDELAIFKRKYNDAIYNLDSDNLGKSFTVTQNNMKAQLKIAADAIKAAVTEEDLALELKKYSTVEQTAEAITSTVTAEYVNTLIGGGYVTNAMMMSQIQQSSEQILLSVSAEYETKADLEEKLKDYATITLTRDGISAYVQSQANLQNAVTITDLSQAIDVGKTYKIQSFNSSGTVIGETYYYYNSLSKSWEKISGDTVYTMFSQTDEGFVLKGNTIIDGNTTITRNLTLSGNVTWDMENSPVLTRYSSDGVSWHSPMVDGDMYMQMSFDGGHSWSTTTKVVGTDGKNGINGSNASVTPQNVFNALTDDGATQGIFAAFVNNNNQLYINAEYLATKIADVADTLYIGDYSTLLNQKSIYFNDRANISTFHSGEAGHVGLQINSNGFNITSKPSEIKFIAPDGSSFVTGSISLADYVAQYASGDGTVIAVFG
ncbi:MAG: hypothetical protein IJ423_05670 [Clostridia bacterium]|nr:hypothetical protein [Clostridia bacterium]MBQ8637459.1 hypothetical protein [Clostridia bacterium]